MAALDVRPVAGALGAEVRGVDLAEPLDQRGEMHSARAAFRERDRTGREQRLLERLGRADIGLARAGASLVGADHKHRVIAGDRSHHVRPFRIVQGSGDRLCPSHHRAHNHLVHRLLHAHPKALQHFSHGGRRIVFEVVPAVAIAVGKGIAAWSL